MKDKKSVEFYLLFIVGMDFFCILGVVNNWFNFKKLWNNFLR